MASTEALGTISLLLLLRVHGGRVAEAFLHGPWNADGRVGPQALDEGRRFGEGLELKRLFRAFREPVRRAAAEVAGVDVGAAVHEDLDDLVQAAKCRPVERGEVR